MLKSSFPGSGTYQKPSDSTESQVCRKSRQTLERTPCKLPEYQAISKPKTNWMGSTRGFRMAGSGSYRRKLAYEWGTTPNTLDSEGGRGAMDPNQSYYFSCQQGFFQGFFLDRVSVCMRVLYLLQSFRSVFKQGGWRKTNTNNIRYVMFCLNLNLPKICVWLSILVIRILKLKKSHLR